MRPGLERELPVAADAAEALHGAVGVHRGRPGQVAAARHLLVRAAVTEVAWKILFYYIRTSTMQQSLKSPINTCI